MSLTFREKSLWLLLLSLVVIFGVYFATALSTATAHVTPIHVSAFIGMLVVLVTIQIVGHTALAIASRRELAASIQSDERDTLISLKSTQRASYVLTVGVFFSLCVAVLVPGNFVFVHVLLAFWFLAQVTEILSQLILYRRGLQPMGKGTRKLSNNLRELRQARGGLTQQELADHVGITRQTIIAIEGNKYSPSLEVAFMIANALETRLEDVFHYDGSAV